MKTPNTVCKTAQKAVEEEGTCVPGTGTTSGRQYTKIKKGDPGHSAIFAPWSDREV